MSFSEYRIMWIMVFFDLPVNTNKERKAYARFRKQLLQDGFSMFQFSIYLRQCASTDNRDVHVKRVKSFLPPRGHVGIISITDKQFGQMEIYYEGRKEKTGFIDAHQLELF